MVMQLSGGFYDRWSRRLGPLQRTAFGLFGAFIAMGVANRLAQKPFQPESARIRHVGLIERFRARLLPPQTVARRVGVRDGMRVLCVSPGEGPLVEALSRIVGRNGRVEAVVLDRPRVSAARAYLETAGIENATIAYVPPTSLPYHDGQFDAVCFQSALGRLSDRRSALAEIRRVLRGAGRFSSSETVADVRYRARKAAENDGEAAGFEILERFGNVLAYTINFRKPLEPLALAFGGA